jgi:hypothetical protein
MTLNFSAIILLRNNEKRNKSKVSQVRYLKGLLWVTEQNDQFRLKRNFLKRKKKLFFPKKYWLGI